MSASSLTISPENLTQHLAQWIRSMTERSGSLRLFQRTAFLDGRPQGEILRQSHQEGAGQWEERKEFSTRT